MEEERPKVGMGIIVVKDNKVLFLKRKGSHGEGTWCLPGGHLEFNESFEDCAKREVIEESGIVIKNIRFAGLTNDLYKDEGKHYITIYMVCDWKSEEARIMEPENHTDIGWFDWDNLPKPLFLSTNNLINQGYNPFK